MSAGGRSGGFAARVVAWQRRHGRHDLPWQGTRDPYRIWLSEIMLQQTQVSTVVPYFLRFLERFPDVRSLARAPLDRVLSLWSGLGYYARARNLHEAARRIVKQHGGRFPTDRESLAALPGIGRSTAAAIAAFSGGAREAILDGNVKRVLCRCFGVDDPPGNLRDRNLWRLAESLLPDRAIESYTQGLMDLGSSICTRSRPRCGECPLADRCEAKRQERQAHWPARAPRKVVPERSAVMLIALCEGEVLLQRRQRGVWEGLWSLPEFRSRSEARRFIAGSHQVLPAMEHRFTHYLLTITPVLCRTSRRRTGEAGLKWFPFTRALGLGIPTPVRELLKRAA